MKKMLLLVALLPFVAAACATPVPTELPTPEPLPTVVIVPTLEPEPVVEPVAYESAAGWNLTIPATWEGMYETVDLTEETLVDFEGATAGTQFVYSPVDTTNMPEPIVTVLSYPTDVWAEMSADATVTMITSCDESVVAVATPEANPYIEGTEDYMGFDEAMMALDLTTAIACQTAMAPVEGEGAVELVGMWTWQGTEMADGTLVEPEDPTLYALDMMDDGTVAMMADCNTGTGAYIVDAEILTFAIDPITMAECEMGSLSADFASQVAEVAGYAIEDGELVLTLAGDAGTMRFAMAE